MHKDSPETISKERRGKARKTQLRNYRVGIQLIGIPIYQFRVTDVSIKGAGLLVKQDSAFLNMIEVNQIINAEFISPTGSNPTGMYKVEIKHITKPSKGKNEGHRLVGISILEKTDAFET
jgi:tmRNA-binding protein